MKLLSNYCVYCQSCNEPAWATLHGLCCNCYKEYQAESRLGFVPLPSDIVAKTSQIRLERPDNLLTWDVPQIPPSLMPIQRRSSENNA